MLHICMSEQDVFFSQVTHAYFRSAVIPAHVADGTDTFSGSDSLSEDPALHEDKYFCLS